MKTNGCEHLAFGSSECKDFESRISQLVVFSIATNASGSRVETIGDLVPIHFHQSSNLDACKRRSDLTADQLRLALERQHLHTERGEMLQPDIEGA